MRVSFAHPMEDGKISVLWKFRRSHSCECEAQALENFGGDAVHSLRSLVENVKQLSCFSPRTPTYSAGGPRGSLELRPFVDWTPSGAEDFPRRGSTAGKLVSPRLVDFFISLSGWQVSKTGLHHLDAEQRVLRNRERRVRAHQFCNKAIQYTSACLGL